VADKLVGTNYVTQDLLAKVTGRAKYAEDFRAEGMLFCKLLVSPRPHARVRSLDTRAALAVPGVKAILTADDLPDLGGAERALTNEPLYGGEPIAAIAARAAPVCRRCARELAARQPQRASRRQRVATACSGGTRAAAAAGHP
jgi:CO/xanthine dehydrogenase Mo-binding subunit